MREFLGDGRGQHDAEDAVKRSRVRDRVQV